MISSFIQDPISLVFCNLYFFYHTLTNGIGFVDRAKFVEICDQSLFTCQSGYIEKFRVLGTNVVTTSQLHSIVNNCVLVYARGTIK